MNEIIIGNSFEVLKTLNDKTFDAIITDVPYDLNEEQKIYLHEHFKRISRGVIIVFSPPENQWILPADQYLFWIKPISTKNTSKSYSRFVEMIFVYNVTTWNTNRHWSQYTNVFKDLVDTSKIHPFRKPPSMLERLILNHTNENDLVLDPFGGSFTVHDVCKRLNRNSLSIEIESKYYREVIMNE